ncbi:hypothetical protein BJP36_38040 [Moorena producens JHB]|uniref:Uncharacterized protein n=1 Tax=Moorena producens (strain JHB) TaxID=1454205 RepID=A0A9Q9SUG3_MOOP1|nr:hypothetical protein [Moorena producens]WAN69896.1 hypothetical protein BJP36_38040 [Moorena producens JHB]
MGNRGVWLTGVGFLDLGRESGIGSRESGVGRGRITPLQAPQTFIMGIQPDLI